MANFTRLTVNITDETAAQLNSLAKANGTTVTNVIRRAVGVYKFLEDELRDEPGRGRRQLQIVDKDKDEVTTVALV